MLRYSFTNLKRHMQLDPQTVQKGTTLGRDGTTTVCQHPRGSHSGCGQAKRTRGFAYCITTRQQLHGFLRSDVQWLLTHMNVN